MPQSMLVYFAAHAPAMPDCLSDNANWCFNFAKAMVLEYKARMRNPEFAALARIPLDANPGIEELLKEETKIMANQSNLTAQMAASVAVLLADLQANAPTQADIQAEIHTVLDPQVATLTTALSAVQASEGNDASAITDLQGAVAAFTTAFAPVAATGSDTGSTPAPATPVTTAPVVGAADSNPAAGAAGASA